MHENQANQVPATDDAATPRTYKLPTIDDSQSVPGPHFAAHSPPVLARVPDVACAGMDGGEPPFSDARSRMLSSGLSMKVLAGVGGLLLLAALGLPFLFSASEFAEPDDGKATSAWEPEQPAPKAPLAPAWGGAPDPAVNWQLAPTVQVGAGPETPADAAWNADAQTPGASAYSQAPPPDIPSQPQGWSGQPQARYPAPDAWNERAPSPRAGIAGPGSANAAGQPYGQFSEDQNRPPAWTGQVNAAAGPALNDQTRRGPSPRTNTTPEDPERRTSSWNETTRTPSWEVPAYRAEQQPSTPVGPAAPDYSTSGQTARSTAIRGSTYPPRYESHAANQRDEYRAADARNALDPGRYGRYPTDVGSQNTTPAATYPPVESIPSRYSTDRYAPSASSPDRYSTGTYTPSASSPGQYPAGGVPAAEPAPVYPTAGGAAAVRTPYGVSATPGYTAGADARYAEPGVARFQGGIEKPTGTNPYDRARSSIY